MKNALKVAAITAPVFALIDLATKRENVDVLKTYENMSCKEFEEKPVGAVEKMDDDAQADLLYRITAQP